MALHIEYLDNDNADREADIYERNRTHGIVPMAVMLILDGYHDTLRVGYSLPRATDRPKEQDPNTRYWPIPGQPTVEQLNEIITAAAPIAETIHTEDVRARPDRATGPDVERAVREIQGIVDTLTAHVVPLDTSQRAPEVNELVAAQADVALHDRQTARRDDAIRAAIAEGVPVSVVSGHTGLSRERVYQIRDRRR